MSFTYFHKKLKDVWTNGFYTQMVENNGVTVPVQVAAPINSPEEGKMEGFEIAYQQQFSFLPGFWKGFGAFANYTKLESEGNYGGPGSVVTSSRNGRVTPPRSGSRPVTSSRSTTRAPTRASCSSRWSSCAAPRSAAGATRSAGAPPPPSSDEIPTWVVGALLVAGGLLVRSFRAVLDVDLGASGPLAHPLGHFDAEAVVAFHEAGLAAGGEATSMGGGGRSAAGYSGTEDHRKRCGHPVDGGTVNPALERALLLAHRLLSTALCPVP